MENINRKELIDFLVGKMDDAKEMAEIYSYESEHEYEQYHTGMYIAFEQVLNYIEAEPHEIKLAERI